MPSELLIGLRREYARAVRYHQDLSLLILDVPPSSEALGRVRDAVRLCDSASPAPGDRLAVILPETTLTGALLVATRLAGALGPSPTTGGPQSVGVATCPSPSIGDAGSLVRAAERALESARSRGGGIRTPTSR